MELSILYQWENAIHPFRDVKNTTFSIQYFPGDREAHTFGKVQIHKKYRANEGESATVQSLFIRDYVHHVDLHKV